MGRVEGERMKECVSVCTCVCEQGEEERENENEIMHVCVYMCVCERERKPRKERENACVGGWGEMTEEREMSEKKRGRERMCV